MPQQLVRRHMLRVTVNATKLRGQHSLSPCARLSSIDHLPHGSSNMVRMTAFRKAFRHDELPGLAVGDRRPAACANANFRPVAVTQTILKRTLQRQKPD